MTIQHGGRNFPREEGYCSLTRWSLGSSLSSLPACRCFLQCVWKQFIEGARRWAHLRMDMLQTLVSDHSLHSPTTVQQLCSLIAVTARAHISVEQLTFTGSPSFDENGETFIPNPDPVKYIGDPIQYPEIDSNWDNLTWGKTDVLHMGYALLIYQSGRRLGRYILITKEEAVRTWGENIELYWDQQRGGYVVG